MENLIQTMYHLDELRTLVVSQRDLDPRIKADIVDAYNIMKRFTDSL